MVNYVMTQQNCPYFRVSTIAGLTVVILVYEYAHNYAPPINGMNATNSCVEKLHTGSWTLCKYVAENPEPHVQNNQW